MLLRVIADTNMFISFLLSRRPAVSSMGAILTATMEGRLTLLFADEIADEIRATIAGRRDLSSKIPVEDVEDLIALLDDIAQPLPRLARPYPPVGRDPKDDYLIVHAVLAEADYLVSWDRDLLDMREFAGVKVVNPPGLLAILREQDVDL